MKLKMFLKYTPMLRTKMTKEELKEKYEAIMEEYRASEAEKKILEERYEALKGPKKEKLFIDVPRLQRMYNYLVATLPVFVILDMIALKNIIVSINNGYYNIISGLIVMLNTAFFVVNLRHAKIILQDIKSFKEEDDEEEKIELSPEETETLNEVRAKLTESYKKCDKLLREADAYNRTLNRMLESETEVLPSIGDVRDNIEIRRRTL